MTTIAPASSPHETITSADDVDGGHPPGRERGGAPTVRRARSLLRRVTDGYASDTTPLGGYLTLTAAYNVLFGAGIVAVARRDGATLDRPSAIDLALLAATTHKVSRLLTKDKVTAFVRAPFTTWHHDATTHGEVEELPRGNGVQRSIGELLTCPYCMGQWVAGGLAVSYALSPRRTRWFASIYTMMTVADFLHLTYLRLTKVAARA